MKLPINIEKLLGGRAVDGSLQSVGILVRESGAFDPLKESKNP